MKMMKIVGMLVVLVSFVFIDSGQAMSGDSYTCVGGVVVPDLEEFHPSGIVELPAGNNSWHLRARMGDAEKILLFIEEFGVDGLSEKNKDELTPLDIAQACFAACYESRDKKSTEKYAATIIALGGTIIDFSDSDGDLSELEPDTGTVECLRSRVAALRISLPLGAGVCQRPVSLTPNDRMGPMSPLPMPKMVEEVH